MLSRLSHMYLSMSSRVFVISHTCIRPVFRRYLTLSPQLARAIPLSRVVEIMLAMCVCMHVCICIHIRCVCMYVCICKHTTNNCVRALDCTDHE